MRRARVGFAFVGACVVGACAGSPARGPLLPAPPTSQDGAAAPDAGASDGVASLDAIAARGATEAPLMREALRVVAAAPRSADVRADKDLCVRALVAASGPVRAWFADDSGAQRGEPLAGVASGAVPPRGPTCLKKGEAVHLVVESAESGAPVTARAVVFAAP